MLCQLPPEASLLVLADVELQVGLRQHGAARNLLRQPDKQTACHTNTAREHNHLRWISCCRNFLEIAFSTVTSCADSFRADGKALQSKNTKGVGYPVALKVYLCVCVCEVRYVTSSGR